MAAALVNVFQRARKWQVPKVSLRILFSSTAQGTDDNFSFARPFNEIPGPFTLPFVGSLFEIVKEGGLENMHILSERRFEKYGPIYKETVSGGTTIVHTNEAAAAETLFRADGKYPKRPLLLPLQFADEQTGIGATLFNR